jgi:predicted GNAT family acetyltransferase
MDAPTVVHAPDDRRFELRLTDGERAGFAEYVVKGGRYYFVHTEIDDAHEGQGYGSKLAQGALDQVQAMGARVVPLCPFIASWIERHPDYDDLVDHELLAHLEAGG